jgi:hypothetical protein
MEEERESFGQSGVEWTVGEEEVNVGEDRERYKYPLPATVT